MKLSQIIVYPSAFPPLWEMILIVVGLSIAIYFIWKEFK